MLYCPKCGGLREQDAKTVNGVSQCPNCKVYFNADGGMIGQSSEQPHYQDKKSGNPKTYIIIYAVLVALGPVLSFLTMLLRGFGENLTQTTSSPVSVSISLASIGALITIVIGFIKCPDSRAIKVLFWITISYVIFTILISVLVLVVCLATCGAAINSCPG